jgi:hypothetical protein
LPLFSRPKCWPLRMNMFLWNAVNISSNKAVSHPKGPESLQFMSTTGANNCTWPSSQDKRDQVQTWVNNHYNVILMCSLIFHVTNLIIIHKTSANGKNQSCLISLHKGIRFQTSLSETFPSNIWLHLNKTEATIRKKVKNKSKFTLTLKRHRYYNSKNSSV